MGIAAKKMFFDLPDYGRVHAAPGGTLNPGGFNRSKKLSDVGVVGHTEEPVAPSLQFKISARENDGISQRALSDLVGINVTVTSDDGKVFLVRGCVSTQPATLSDGEFDLNLEGDSCEEIS